jgi:hypothetical protein
MLLFEVRDRHLSSRRGLVAQKSLCGGAVPQSLIDATNCHERTKAQIAESAQFGGDRLRLCVAPGRRAHSPRRLLTSQ